MRHILTITSVAIALLISYGLFADSWLPMKPEVIEREYVFGETTILRIIDGRENQMYPTHSIKVLKDGKLVALYPGLSFRVIEASKNESLFIGVSNSGKPDTAIIIFDNEGRLGFWLRHSHGHLQYCRKSVTLTREWYDSADPDIQFVYSESGEIEDITIKSCGKGRLSIADLSRPHRD